MESGTREDGKNVSSWHKAPRDFGSVAPPNRQHQKLLPNDEKTRFWIAAMSGDAAAMQAMPADLVAGLFDQYADKFDNHLVHALQYRTPQLLM